MFSEEFKDNKVLQWALGALVFGYFVAFYSFIRSSAVTVESFAELRHTCRPYFQSCGDWYFLQALPEGYSQTLLYMLFFGVMAWCVYLISQQQWREVQLSLAPLFLWHASLVLFFTDSLAGNYEYYLFAFSVVLLFLPHKEFFLKLVLVLFYTLSVVAKIHPSWIEGGYFTAMQTGLPLFPDWSIPFWTNLVIVMELVGAWFLISKNRILQRGALVFFALFHLYSGILVQYHYPATVLPMLLIAFGPWYRVTPVPLDKRSIGGWLFIVLLIFLQFTPKLISGDEKLTLEGNKYGLYMFEANHQCISEATVHLNDGSTKAANYVGESARNRCDPYRQWFRFSQLCMTFDDIDRVEWTFDHSINGGPFYRIVDTNSACDLTYHPFRHNEWIKTADEAAIIGYPVKNYYR